MPVSVTKGEDSDSAIEIEHVSKVRCTLPVCLVYCSSHSVVQYSNRCSNLPCSKHTKLHEYIYKELVI